MGAIHELGMWVQFCELILWGEYIAITRIMKSWENGREEWQWNLSLSNITSSGSVGLPPAPWVYGGRSESSGTLALKGPSAIA